MTGQEYMRRAIELAKKGAGWTAPNPMVGAVIVKEGNIIGEGYHKRCGELHAERNAFASLTQSAEGSTIYVTLEPCCHYGRTPPCTEAIIEHGIKKVIIGSRDPNPLVSGKGAAILREHGIEVVEDFLRDECDALNPVFFHYITTKMPYTVMKYAMTLDGKIAAYTGKSKWITGETAREHVHSLRSRYSAILAGIGTVLADDPLLNSRLPGAHQPIRVIADSNLRIPLDSQIVQTARQYRTIVVCAEANEEKEALLTQNNVEVLHFPDRNGHVDLHAVAAWLGENGIDSLLIEGGGNIHESALKSEIVNHVCAYIAPKILGGKDAKTPVEGIGFDSPDSAAQLENMHFSQLGKDILLEFDIKGEIQ